MTFGTVNIIAVVIAAIVSILIGAFWYSPAAFGKPWMSLMGFKRENMKKHKKEAQKSYILGFISALVMAYVLALFFSMTGVSTAGRGIYIGFLFWLGFIATVSLGSILWEGKPAKLYFINVFYNLVSLIVMGAILGTWV